MMVRERDERTTLQSPTPRHTKNSTHQHTVLFFSFGNRALLSSPGVFFSFPFALPLLSNLAQKKRPVFPSQTPGPFASKHVRGAPCRAPVQGANRVVQKQKPIKQQNPAPLSLCSRALRLTRALLHVCLAIRHSAPVAAGRTRRLDVLGHRPHARPSKFFCVRTSERENEKTQRSPVSGAPPPPFSRSTHPPGTHRAPALNPTCLVTVARAPPPQSSPPDPTLPARIAPNNGHRRAAAGDVGRRPPLTTGGARPRPPGGRPGPAGRGGGGVLVPDC